MNLDTWNATATERVVERNRGVRVRARVEKQPIELADRIANPVDELARGGPLAQAREVAQLVEDLERLLRQRRVQPRVVHADAVRYLADAPEVDLVLADPPYSFDGWEQLLGLLVGRASLLVAETGQEWEPGPGWETVKAKRYGGTLVTVVQPPSRLRSPLREEGEA